MRVALWATVLGLVMLGAACAPGADPTPVVVGREVIKEVNLPGEPVSPGSLTIYSGRSEELVGPVIELFRQASGIDVKVKYGETAELAATILEEGRNSRADVFFAQDPGGLAATESLFAALPEHILNSVEPRFRSPFGKWVGVSGRARVVVYNTDRLTENDLPDDIWDFIDPQWKGRIGWAPTNGSFQAMVTAMRTLWGDARTKTWLERIRANGAKEYPKNTPIVAAVGAGEIEVGFVNHYYLYRFLQEEGESFPARNYHPRAGGPGALVLVAGAGVLETAKNKDNAVRFLEFMLSPVSQQYFGGQTFEYPVIEGVKTNRLLPPLASIRSPEVDMASLGDLKGTLDLMRQAGALP
ncbi:MAG: iron ABC transporter substrate-binding protein [Chloroflexi bacterium]|nr:iron ABC transporter substrate-binding protein [Chloroflexota bacterium]